MAMVLMALGVLAIIWVVCTTMAAKQRMNTEQSPFLGQPFAKQRLFPAGCECSMFFICATTLAWGGWQMAFRRVPEAISALVPVFGTDHCWQFYLLLYLEVTILFITGQIRNM